MQYIQLNIVYTIYNNNEKRGEDEKFKYFSNLNISPFLIKYNVYKAIA